MLWLVYLLTAIAFMSTNIILVKTLLKKVKPFLVLFYQYIVAVPLVLIYSISSWGSFNPNILWILFIGIIYVAALGIFYTGLSKGPLSKVAPIFNLNLLVTSALAIWFLGEPLTLNIIIGLACGAVSVYLLGGARK